MIVLTYSRDYKQVISRVVLREVILIWMEAIVSTMKERISDMICMPLRHATSKEKHTGKGGYSRNRHSLHEQMGRHPFGVALFIAHFDVFFYFPHFNGVGHIIAKLPRRKTASVVNQ